jgi:hypothetical protein
MTNNMDIREVKIKETKEKDKQSHEILMESFEKILNKPIKA